MIWFWQHREQLTCSLNVFFKAMSTSKQNLHQLIGREMRQMEDAANILHLVGQIRLDHPTMSCRAMYYKLRPLPIGRDAFEALCKSHGYQSGIPRTAPRTTNSAGVIRFDNLYKDLVLTHIDQVWSSDITYFEIGDHFYYLTFILDCYSRLIMGYSVSKSLCTEQTVIASLKMAIKRRNGRLVLPIIFHSDGGGQFYAKDFLKLTRHYHFLNSMGEYAWENGKSERLNGIIKSNYLQHWKIKSFEELQRSVDRAVQLYNQEKPHKALGYMTPESFESKWLSLQKQTKPTMTESLDANTRCEGASSPLTSKQTKPQNRDVLSATAQK